MYLAYSVLLAIGSFLALPWFLWKDRETGRYRSTFRERMGRLPAGLNGDGRRSVWIHAVSVGEVLTARALIPALRERFPKLPVFLSTTTVTGNAVARQSARGTDGLFYAPFDWPGPVRKALSTVNPALLVLVETEIWPTLIHEAHRRGVRIAVVNGRISPRSYPRYRRIRGFIGSVLAEVDLFLMQGEPHAERVRALGAPTARVRVTGNLKFDAPDAAPPAERLVRLLQAQPDRPLLVAGSTAAGEEEMVLRAFARLLSNVPEACLIVAPRHPERFEEVSRLVEATGSRCLRRTTLTEDAVWRNGDVLLLDTLGELASVYALATVVFVGGSLVPAGGHNVIEAAVAGKPVLVGPHMENFQEIADDFRSEQALVQVDSPEALAREVTHLFTDDARRRGIGERARGLVDRNRGALRMTLDALAGALL